MSKETSYNPDHEIVFADEALEETARATERAAWPILIVDDDAEVHEGTVFALKDEIILGRRLAFAHAYSAAEALTMLRENGEYAIVLLDVVMESKDAGLELVKILRESLKLLEPRIILRTGQPGYAPESAAIRLYDINDYRTKSELTHTRLLTSVTAALRSYEQIHSLSSQRRGLQKIIDASVALSEKAAIDTFAEGVIIQIGTLLHMPPEGILCVQTPRGDATGDARVIGAAGRYLPRLGCSLAQIDDTRITGLLHAAIEQKTNLFHDDATVLYIPIDNECEGAVFVDTAAPLTKLDEQLLSVFCTNITGGMKNVRLMDELRGLAFFDPVTQLPNRSHFLQQLDAALARGETQQMVAIVDIDHFSEINDALGHSMGDALLKALGQRLREQFASCAVARVAGDNFAVLAPESMISSDQINALCRHPFDLTEVEIPISLTAGLVHLHDVVGSAPDVLKAASIALKQAKTHALRGHCEFYRREMDERPLKRLAIYRNLRQALLDRVLTVHYQPQINLESGTIEGVEALVRWRNEDGSYLPPDSFIPVAESTGLIVGLGEFVFAESCYQLTRWRDAGAPSLRMAINVSMAQLLNPHFLPFVEATLKETGVAPSQIEIEITESMLMNDAEGTIELLGAIRALGVAIAIDDFGTGFSSLSYLQRLPIDRLKVDRGFVKDLGSSPRGETIARMVVQLGKTLDLAIIGEGIETETQAEILRGWGCHEGQGFLYSPALPADQLMEWIARRGRQ